MGRNSRRIKERAEELRDDYQDARDVAFHEAFCSLVEENDNFEHVWTEEELEAFVKEFDFPVEDDWIFQQVDSELDDIGDQKYQEWKERDIE